MLLKFIVCVVGGLRDEEKGDADEEDGEIEGRTKEQRGSHEGRKGETQRASEVSSILVHQLFPITTAGNLLVLAGYIYCF